MSIKHCFYSTLGLLGAALLTFSLTEAAWADYPGYVTDADGRIVKSKDGRCVRTQNWTADMVVPPECGGIADSDGDGVPDDRDKCPGTPAGVKVDDDGCEILEKVILGSKEFRFAFDSAELSPEVKAEIDRKVPKVLQNIAGVEEVRVTGHTDSVGAEEYNQGLSERRARALADYLIVKGVPAEKLVVTGKGESEPAADNATADGRAQNRRVEIEFEM